MLKMFFNKTQKGEMMKKLMMIAATAMMIVGSVCAGDVYSVKMSGKMPIIKHTQGSYYKDFASFTYQGFIDINYELDGTMVSPAAAVLYGNFDGTNGFVITEVNLDVANVFGTTVDNFETYLTAAIGNMNVSFAGTGKVKHIRPVATPCNEIVDCTNPTIVYNVNGSFIGITLVACDPCGGKPWAWLFNHCPVTASALGLESNMIEATVDVVYGNWTMLYNGSTTKACAVEPFETVVIRKIPLKYKTQLFYQ